ncbi:trypsin-3-like [Metopolophium dirhodum]|uniref:trypsin-3-like n=1 Tax=Metopolophium dirhodum TaxID=44670 RepID=UPI00298F84AA|nr:trypsin-3-like [Metopolophium dirhodum]
MIQIIILILLFNCLITTVVTFEENMLSYENKGLIANGEIYDVEKYPFVVCLVIRAVRKNITGKAVCTGSLISPLFVLTAAHCTVGVTTSNINVYSGKSHQHVQRIYRHHMFDPEKFLADICLLKLRKPFKNVGRYVSLSGHPDEFSNGKPLNCVVIGFGITEQNTKPKLRGFMTNSSVTYGPTACKLFNTSNIMDTWNEYLCSKPDIHMVCPGDSGGPMICNGSLYGIASHGYNFKEENKDIDCGSPDVQTRHLFLYTYRKWIADTTNKGNTLIPHYKSYITTIILVLYYYML